MPSQTWTNTALTADQRADALLAAMSLADKIALVHGVGGPYVGNVAANPALGIPRLTLEDGPAGVGDGARNVTAFPAPILIAASWDVKLARQFGAALGQEARGKGVQVLLAPMMNMARAYQDGRAFEGYGEDPFLSAAMAAAEVQGIQSQGVIATAKHFVCNDQETDRTTCSSDVGERTRQEIYYMPFRAAVEAGAGAVMASYNRVNSRYACESPALNAALKESWGFDGFVMSDWGAHFSTVAAANNGLDLEMPSDTRFGATLQKDVSQGLVPTSELNGMVHRILATMFRFGLFDHPATGKLSDVVTNAAQDQFVRQAAEAGVVLLKNSGNVLPLDPASVHSIAVIGRAAGKAPISTGGGSAHVRLPYNITPLTGISNRAGAAITVRYAQGDKADLEQAVGLARRSDVAIVCVGQRTHEGADRASLSLPDDQDALVKAVATANPNTIVVLYCSAPTLMPWIQQVRAALVAWYPGQENGNALAAILFGDADPSGKLPTTFPAAANEVPAHTPAQFPGVKGHVAYSEGLDMGYRWYDAHHVAPLFPFGYGLSYTTFAYSNLTMSAVSPSGQVRIGFDLTNTGRRAGAEVAELYLEFPDAAGEPPKLLKAFQKVFLAPGQTRPVTFHLDWEDLANWSASALGWVVTPGRFHVLVGASSRDIRLRGAFTVAAPIPSSDLANAALFKPVTVSSTLKPDTPGSAAVDGNTETAWCSAAGRRQWITVDLGLTRDLSRVRLLWNTNYASGYAIQISEDDTNWTTVLRTNRDRGGMEDVLVSGRGRYVRVDATTPALPGRGYSLSELEVYSRPERPYNGVVPNLPGNKIQAEDYDTGGQGVAYHDDTPGNAGGVFRADDVDIEPTTDAGGGYAVGWIAPGEWLEYTVHVPDRSAIYRLKARVASATGGQMRVRLNGTVLGTFHIPDTGGGQHWRTVTLPEVPVAGGRNELLRLEMLSGGFNVNWVEFDRTAVNGG